MTLPPDIESWPAGHRLADVLDSTDPYRLPAADRVRYVQAAERLAAHAQAQALTGIGAIAEAYHHSEDGDPERVADGTGFELRAALSWTRRHAESELDFAVDLLVRLPAVLEALRAGRIDKRRARIIVSDTSHLSVAHARTAAAQILTDAGSLTTGQLRNRVRKACLDTDPDACRAQLKKAKRERNFLTWIEQDGTMSLLLSGLDPQRGQELASRVNRVARQLKNQGDLRTMDQLRADVATDSLTGTDHPAVGSVHLTIDLAALADPQVQSGLTLAGYGPILHDILDQIDGSPPWEWTATSGGVPIADGHTRRRPTTSQRRRIRATHPMCIAPGCRMPAISSDLDHTRPYSESGNTDSSEMAPLCRHDHRIRHTTGWNYTVSSEGTITWTSPIGTTYTTSARDP